MSFTNFQEREYENFDLQDLTPHREPSRVTLKPLAEIKVHILRDKLSVPKVVGMMARPRVEQLLERSVAAFPATMIIGRTGTGKTAIAASFAQDRRTAWLNIEPSEAEWRSFAAYFAAAVWQGSETAEALPARFAKESTPEIQSAYIESVFSAVETPPELIVLDDAHHLFDAPWFADVFTTLVRGLPAASHLVMLCRSKPPNPLWRMRSKQMLGVIDERLLAFDRDEARRLFKSYGLAARDAGVAFRRSYGRPVQLAAAADTLRKNGSKIG